MGFPQEQNRMPVKRDAVTIKAFLRKYPCIVPSFFRLPILTISFLV
jgi:hypothetical protein